MHLKQLGKAVIDFSPHITTGDYHLKNHQDFSREV